MNKKIIPISVILLISFSTLTTNAEDTIPLIINDGPYVVWENDTTAVTFYVCDDKIDSQTFFTSDTFSFQGRCYDSLSSYKIRNQFETPPSIYENVNKFIALSDLHGEYEYLVEILKNSKVIDDNLKWIYGTGHLVIDGDIFDRGDMVTECLWLIYRLEQEAITAGGFVHYLLGNHELMVLRGDNRYIHEKYLKGITRKTRIKHEEIFGPESELGRWLRTKNVVEKIDGILFNHSGISPEITELNITLDDLNNEARNYLDLSSLELAFNKKAKLYFGSLGLFWYRGYFEDIKMHYPPITFDQLENLLLYFQASAIVVGHSEQDKISIRHNRNVIAIDVPVFELEGFQALLWENDSFFIIHPDGSQESLFE